MMEGETAEGPTLFPATVGERLRGAREAQGLELAEVAARTRIPQRHLEAIEKSNYEGLPSVTYSIGFAKSYARAVGIDEVEIARELRTELGGSPERAMPTPSYEVEDPTHVPPRGLAWAGIVVALLVLVGVGLWYGTGLFRGSAPPPESLTIPEGTSAGAPGTTTPAAAPVTGGQVTLVALDTVWLRVSDAKGERLFEKEMAANERYDVPANAEGPHVRTPRPDRLQVLINGSNVPPLSTKAELVDVQVSAAALQARGQAAPAASPSAAPVRSPSPVSAPSATPSPTPTRAPVRPTPSPTPRASPQAATSNTTTAP
ncbi:MAG: helix-turn-helix domain-containing protein [Sphingomonadales bacterium]|nr:MAG: helix-turn-helix domain-containing protein [Sphingomonadales bacterium]